METVRQIHSYYMREAFGDMSKLARRARLRLEGVKFDTMIGTGLSGALVIPRLAAEFDAHWFIVRKEKDGSHSSYVGEGSIGKRWLFVDDLIDSGETLKRVQLAVKEACSSKYGVDYANYAPFDTEYVGAYLYTRDYRSFREPGTE
jgi:hypoxanthine phosphoribosyltransferase